ncbi:Protein of unknown function DUF2917 [Solidesulfovibrio carbinoliphilus subsp. oakridgensis]|uniref:DUF2917 domain-containing protein n=1 Tax=Solidesulfovibrio carbinoliphilus subsp. oakridgensis TaxID=694327 RepID=G7Q6M9_9BACT|nr:DUF2917 domain-containing protein [Solidesulfovibrio carbinoliphilus]EHJ47642.1 Protein of unknown function DUF2917 [Solidesulfovibrio carbinoliphilus subsp. oakridgensis]
MFAQRSREDRAFEAARVGIVDAWIARWRDSRLLRVAAEAGSRIFSPARSLTFRLGHGKYLALTGVRYCRVRCDRGAIWVTATGDGRDRVLTPGQSLTLGQAGKVVISGRGEASEVRVRWD